MARFTVLNISVEEMIKKFQIMTHILQKILVINAILITIDRDQMQTDFKWIFSETQTYKNQTTEALFVVSPDFLSNKKYFSSRIIN